MGDKKFVFHLIPSGIMHEDKICVIGNGVVLDPIQTLDEIADLHTKGINPEGRLFIADNAHVVLPYHSTLKRRLVRLLSVPRVVALALAIATR